MTCFDVFEHFVVSLDVRGRHALEAVGESDRDAQRSFDCVFELCVEAIVRRMQDGDMKCNVGFERVVVAQQSLQADEFGGVQMDQGLPDRTLAGLELTAQPPSSVAFSSTEPGSTRT